MQTPRLEVEDRQTPRQTIARAMSFGRRRLAVDDPFFDEGNLASAASCKWAFVPAAPAAWDDGAANTIPCGHGGCARRCASWTEMDAHFQSAHRHTCQYCQRVLPTDRLLSIHVSELHAAYFRATARRAKEPGGCPVFECLVAGCAVMSATSGQRKQHLVKDHHFPRSFDFHRKPKRLAQQHQHQHQPAHAAGPAALGSEAGGWAQHAGSRGSALGVKDTAAVKAVAKAAVAKAAGMDDDDPGPIGTVGRGVSQGAAAVKKKDRRPRNKKKDPSCTPCFFSTTPKGCSRGAKCPFLHGVVSSPSSAATAQGRLAAFAPRRSGAESSGDDEDAGGQDGAAGGASVDDEGMSDGGVGSGGDDEAGVADLAAHVARLRLPKNITFGRRGRAARMQAS